MERKNAEAGSASRRSYLPLVAGLFATVIGLCNMVGELTNQQLFSRVGNAFGIAPAPNPYTYFNHGPGLQFGCEDAAGNVTWHVWDYRMRSAIPGPHRRAVTFLAYLAHMEIWRHTDATVDGLELRNRYYFCNGGPFAQAVGCPRDLRAVQFVDERRRPPGEPTRYRRVACSAE